MTTISGDAGTALTVDGLSVRFHTAAGTVPALSDVSLHVAPGEFLVVAGESGSGKSVLAAAVLGTLPRNATVEGTVRVGGDDVSDLDRARLRQVRREHVAYIPQSPATALNPVRRVGSLLAELARARGLPAGQARRQLRAALAELHLDYEEIAPRYPHQLSGGMQQRVLNALAMVGRPQLVIADEPTSGLDADLVDTTAAQLRRLVEHGAGVLVITHDLRLARRLGGRLALLYASHLVEWRTTADFFAGPAHPYGQGLLAALPEHGGRPIPGQPVELTALPAGCPFRSRCHQAVEQCAGSMPPPHPVPDTDGVVRCHLYARRSADVAR
jgi:peptide/nickel transport system ATP-binding protein